MAMSTVANEESSRGRSASRWWESNSGSSGIGNMEMETSGSIVMETSGSMVMKTSLAAESLSPERGGSPIPDCESNERLQSTDSMGMKTSLAVESLSLERGGSPALDVEGFDKSQEEQVQRLLDLIRDQPKAIENLPQAEDNYWTRRSHPASSASSINSQLRSSVSGLKKQPEKSGQRPEPFNDEKIFYEAETQNLKRENRLLEMRIKALGTSRYIRAFISCRVCSTASAG
jgi:hypothetical protein